MEKIYNLAKSSDKLIEKLVDDDPVMINHILLNQGDCVPKHMSNSNVYIIILKGSISILLNGSQTVEQQAGNILSLPYGLDMEISNQHTSQLEFLVVKAPNPRLYNNEGKA